jgi:4-hydroxy-tetrahydrodipicolinate synthase
LPKQTAKICNSFLSGDYKESLIAQTALLPLINALFLETNPTPIKYALSQKGLCTEEVRLPLSSATDATKNIIASLMQE